MYVVNYIAATLAMWLHIITTYIANCRHILIIIFPCVCFVVNCSSLTDPDNGMISCSLRDDGVPSYEDTCSFTCNTGYELTGSDTRTCQSDGSWSGSDDVCRRGMYKTIMMLCYNHN